MNDIKSWLSGHRGRIGVVLIWIVATMVLSLLFGGFVICISSVILFFVILILFFPATGGLDDEELAARIRASRYLERPGLYETLKGDWYYLALEKGPTFAAVVECILYNYPALILITIFSLAYLIQIEDASPGMSAFLVGFPLGICSSIYVRKKRIERALELVKKWDEEDADSD